MNDFQVVFRAYLALINIHICDISWSCSMVICNIPGLPRCRHWDSRWFHSSKFGILIIKMKKAKGPENPDYLDTSDFLKVLRRMSNI